MIGCWSRETVVERVMGLRRQVRRADVRGGAEPGGPHPAEQTQGGRHEREPVAVQPRLLLRPLGQELLRHPGELGGEEGTSCFT